MTKIIPSLLFCFFLLSNINGQRLLVDDSMNGILVQLSQGINGQKFLDQNNLDKQFGLSVKEVISERFNFYLLETSETEKYSAALEALNASSKVISAIEDRPLDFRAEPDDPFWPQQWGMERIGAPQVWDVTTGGLTANGDEIVVAVVDRGFDIEHEDWQGNIWVNPGEISGNGVDDDGDGIVDNVNGYNFFSNSQTLIGEDHGTWVTGIVGSKGNNGIGVAGINWDVKMMLLRIEFPSDVVEAFQFVLEERERYNASNGADGSFIVATNGSFGINAAFCDTQPAWAALYDPLGEEGVLSVAATANEDWDVDIEGDMPTTCTSEYIIAVTAVDTDDEKVSNAAYGAESIDIGAPTFVPSTRPGNEFRENVNGTSAACPHVAGAVALMYSLPCTEIADMAKDDPAGAARFIRDALLQNAELLSDLQGVTTTGGILNVYETMKYLHAYCISRAVDREAEPPTFKEDYIEQEGFVYLSPNPVSQQLNITYGNDGFGEVAIRIFNSIGQEMEVQAPVANKPFEAQTIIVDVSDWSNGTYFVAISGSEKDSTMKFVKN